LLSFATTTILLLGLTFYCLFDKKKITAHSLGRPSRSDFVQSEFTGEINSSGQTGTVSVTLGDDSKWVLTGDSYISEFDGDTDNIVTNGFHVYVDGKELV